MNSSFIPSGPGLCFFAKVPFKGFPVHIELKIHLGLDTRKPLFRASDQVRINKACSATETSQKMKNFHVRSLGIILSKEGMAKVLIRLCACTCNLVYMSN